MWTQIRLLQDQSDLGLHCLIKIHLKHFSRLQLQTTFVTLTNSVDPDENPQNVQTVK